MKNILKSKAFPAAILSIACIGILSVCWIAGREEKTEFQPEDSAPETAVQEWKDTPAPATDTQEQQGTPTAGHTGTGATAYAPAQSQATADDLEAYPKVVEETEQLVTIDFTPESEKLQPDPPETPVAEGDAGNPDQPPVYAPEELEPEPTSPPAQPEAPAAGASNGNGAVYDPVFGWVVPGQVSQTPMDSAGDPDKMVGNM